VDGNRFSSPKENLVSEIAYPVKGNAQVPTTIQDCAKETAAPQEESFSPTAEGSLRVLDLEIDWSNLSRLVSSVEAMLGQEASDRNKELLIWLMNLERRLPPYDI
jgi:hypothetical protein